MTNDLPQFLEFLISLAPEGETPLIVRQKPQLKDNAYQHHADGAIKCTWPATLPDAKKIKKNQSWYGNTASFIIDRFEEGKISASAANCEYCLVMVLDDIGSKCEAPPLPPTWVMETSEGSFQWGYAFTEEQPTKGEFAAAIKAIADAGFTDPGALNPVRNFRLPGSINIKPDRGQWAAVLREFYPEREYTLSEICAALGAVPKEADTAKITPVRVKDTGHDDVFSWLMEQGMVLSKPNPEGWAGVICPNSAEHTDGNPEGRYNPTTRAYCCLHGHCVDFDTKTFLAWVAENGGPDRPSGLRDDLIAKTMEKALQDISPSDYFSDSAEQVLADVETREAGRVAKTDWYKRFAYVVSDDAYFDMVTRKEFKRNAFNAIFRHVSCNSVHNNRRVESSICYDENRQAMGAKVLSGVTYAAGESVMVAQNGDVYGNRWSDARPPRGVSGDISRWIEHCQLLVPEPAELEHIYDVMAFKLQNPRVKINHAVLHGGTQGCGKDTMWAPFIWSVCGSPPKNYGLIKNEALNSQWGYDLQAEIVVLNELKEPEAKERRALANRLKPIIAAPPETISINRKGLHPYDMVNRLFVLAFTNDPVPISIDSADRRWFCVWSAAPIMQESEAAAMWAWYNREGFEAIASWLYDRDVSKFNPAATPMWTEFKTNLVELGMSMAESYLVELIRGRLGEFAKGAIGSPFHAVCDRLTGAAPSGVKLPQAALLHALHEAGWIDMGRISSADFPTKKHIFCAPDMRFHSKSDLRRMLEDEPPTMGQVLRIHK